MCGASLGHHQTGIIYLPHHVKFEATKNPVGIIKPGLRSTTSDSRAVRLAIVARYSLGLNEAGTDRALGGLFWRRGS
jgi:hypothetical protein